MVVSSETERIVNPVVRGINYLHIRLYLPRTLYLPSNNYLMHFDAVHVIVPLGDHARDAHVHVDHDGHRNEKRTHRGEDNVALVLIVSAFVQVTSTLFVPAECVFRLNDVPIK